MKPKLSQFPDFISVLENSDSMIMTRFDSRGVVTFISKGVESLMGIPQSDLVGESSYCLQPKGALTYERTRADGLKISMQSELWSESSGAVFTIEKVHIVKNGDTSAMRVKNKRRYTSPITGEGAEEFKEVDWTGDEQKVAHSHSEVNSKSGCCFEGGVLRPRCFSLDNTENVVLLREKVSSKARLEDAESRAQVAHEASKMKSAFIATISHEIRTPLNGVIGMASLLNMTVLSMEQQEYVNTILASANTLLSLIGNVLDVTKIESGKIELNPAPFNLSQMVRGVCRGMEYKAKEKGVNFTTRMCSRLDDVSFVGDANRITQVLLNFLSNALKFTNEGSVECRITCEAYSDEERGMEEEVEEDRSDRVVALIEVVDTGIGIEDCSALFSPFVQGKKSVCTDYGGSGLGLSISKQLVTLMGGTVGLESEGVSGMGSRVWAEIPLRRLAPEEMRVVQQMPERLSAGEFVLPTVNDAAGLSFHPRVLLVDDNKVNRKILSHMLRNLAYRDVDQAVDGQQAVDAVKEAWTAGQPYDVIFMDCQMPVLDGWMATTAIRAFEGMAGNKSHHVSSGRRQDTTIIALTANVSVEDRQKSQLCGMDDFLTKPLTAEALDLSMRKWVPRILGEGSEFLVEKAN